MAKFRQPPNSAAEATIVSKNITANGTYNASADSADGYNPVTVAVPEKTIVSKSITANGTYNASADSADGYNPVIVAVPEKTIVSKSITANGTYNASSDNADGYDPIIVNVPTVTSKKAVHIWTKDAQPYNANLYVQEGSVLNGIFTPNGSAIILPYSGATTPVEYNDIVSIEYTESIPGWRVKSISNVTYNWTSYASDSVLASWAYNATNDIMIVEA